ncbi:hypothetical protein DUZ99_12375 [Xylanibacillus composti]|uniref:Uncharacterized protein n=1 Tax=Xylanibacillus composti TaxID=1572762 RepID=A0A8J4M0I8_9BACL|nr:hypothetical protein [Xylanibacillus composti]MDT9725767.1 hypothetical protein [Xylanibacillus composti]GIQ67519.1 hypothetical protein XYCOK13_03430 [Xylanibacillus composti]
MYPTVPPFSCPWAYGPYGARPYPPVDTQQFSHAVSSFQSLILSANQVLSSLARPAFAHQFMAAAQAGNHAEVDRLLKSIGSHADIETSYTPSGVAITLREQAAAGSPCCSLTMHLRWGM